VLTLSRNGVVVVAVVVAMIVVAEEGGQGGDRTNTRNKWGANGGPVSPRNDNLQLMELRRETERG
jgi:hypothetical protein